MKRSLQKLWSKLPDGRSKRMIWSVARRVLPRRLYASKACNYALIEELRKLEIASAGLDQDGSAFVRLRNGGPTCFGYPSSWSEIATYAALPEDLRHCFPETCCRLALDVVCRYVYPQALADRAPHYPYEDRGVFHRQHRDTVDDLVEHTEEQKQELRRIFSVHEGDVILDVGAFIGLGAMRLSGLVGPNGKVIGVEAHPANQVLFTKNIQANRCGNVQLVKKGVWNERGELQLNCESFQMNSFVTGLVKQNAQLLVPTDSLDHIVGEIGLTHVSLVSLTVNGAELEALEGMQRLLTDVGPKLSIAGWYQRDGLPLHHAATRLLRQFGYQTVVGRLGRVLAWKSGRT